MRNHGASGQTKENQTKENKGKVVSALGQGGVGSKQSCVESNLDCKVDPTSHFLGNYEVKIDVQSSVQKIPYLMLSTWVVLRSCFSVSKQIKGSRQEWSVSLLLIQFQTSKFLLAYDFRVQVFSVRKK